MITGIKLALCPFLMPVVALRPTRIGCKVPVAVGIQVGAFHACAHRPFTLVFKTHRRELAVVVLHNKTEMAAM